MTDLLSNRTYLLSPRAKSVIDNASIMLPGFSKTDVINTAIFLLGSEISIRRKRNEGLTSVKSAFDDIREELGEIGYDEIIQSVIPDIKSQTRLDRFLDKDAISDAETTELAELIAEMISSPEQDGGSDE